MVLIKTPEGEYKVMSQKAIAQQDWCPFGQSTVSSRIGYIQYLNISANEKADLRLKEILRKPTPRKYGRKKKDVSPIQDYLRTGVYKEACGVIVNTTIPMSPA